MVAHMDIGRVRWLGAELTAAADDMRTYTAEEGWALGPAYVPASAFGNVSASSACAEAWRDVVAEATRANGNLRQVLESDATRVDEVIACFASTDAESADDMCAATTTVTVLSAHLHSTDGAPPEWDDYLRATQHDRLVDYATGRNGAVIAGLDANVSIDRDEHGDLAEYGAGPLAPEAVARFGDEGFENVGDFSDGRPGEGTASSDKSIDYIWSRDLSVASPAREVQGDPSDHNGQSVAFRLPRW